MHTESRENIAQRQPWLAPVLTLCFFVTVNALSGFLALHFHYESLFNVNPKFAEYAYPLPFTWALAHLPSTLALGVCLLLMPRWQPLTLRNFRLIVASIFILLFLELDKKIPFVLFWKVDCFCGVIFSLILIPPNFKTQPILAGLVTLAGFVAIAGSSWYAYSLWSHQPPAIHNKRYVQGTFELQAITVEPDYRHELGFHIELTRLLPEAEVCAAVQELGNALLRDYPFDDTYNKVIFLGFVASGQESNAAAKPVGEISLNLQHRQSNGQFPCAVYY